MHIIKGNKPEFCFITPIEYLEYALKSSSHLVLAHLVDTNKEYADFYKHRRSVGDFIMMDNSAYELKEPYSPNKLIKLAERCGANAIVLPDYPFQPSSVTVKAAQEFIPQFKDAGYLTFFVPQSERGDIGDWINGYNWAANHPDIDIIGMSILGVPNALSEIHYGYARVVMTQKLIDAGYFNFDKHHHYLGLNSGVALEIPSLLNMRALDTIDSSGPVQAALMGHEYTKNSDSYQTVKKLKMPVDFDIAYSKDTEVHDRIVHNIELTLELFENHDEVKTWYAEE